MATNRHFPTGNQLSLPVTEGVVSGDAVVSGHLTGVALTDRGSEGNASTHATVQLDGVFDLSVDGTVATVGLPVYITTVGAVTATAGTNALLGHALATKGSGEGVIPVRLAGASLTPKAPS